MTDEHQRHPWQHQRWPGQSRHQIGDIIFIVSKNEAAEESLMKELKSHAFIILNIIDADFADVNSDSDRLGEPPYYEARSIPNNFPLTVGSINDIDYIVL